MNWAVSGDAHWLNLSPASGNSTGQWDDVTVSVDCSGMVAGSYTASITISATGATNTPQTVPVSLTINQPPSIIACSPMSFSFTATQGSSYVPDQTLGIWNSGGGTLNWSVADNANWLYLSPTSGSSTGGVSSVTLSIITSYVVAGSYTASITIWDTKATNTPQIIPVSLTVNSAPSTIGYSPSSFSFIVTQGSNPASQNLEIWNSGGGTLSWSVSDSATWLSVYPSSGISTGVTNNVTVSANTYEMSAGTYSASITISASGATNTPQTIPVSLEINQSVHNYGPYVIDIGTSQGNRYISLTSGQRVEFSFTVSGSLVWFKVLDPNGNIMVTGAGGQKVSDGAGSFTASASGSYAIQFISSGILTPSLITLYYTIYG